MSFVKTDGAVLDGSRRLTLLIFSLCVLGGFVLAAMMEPDPRGFGTHRQLGLPPCTFRLIFGIPCPSCGGTTSFAHFVRGQWWQSLHSNAAAFVLALTGALCVPWAWWSCARGETVFVSSPTKALLWWLLVISGLAAAQWGWRLLA